MVFINLVALKLKSTAVTKNVFRTDLAGCGIFEDASLKENVCICFYVKL